MTKPVEITVRTTPHIRAALEQMADVEVRSLSNLAAKILADYVAVHAARRERRRRAATASVNSETPPG
jgi:hypothetical protein